MGTHSRRFGYCKMTKQSYVRRARSSHKANKYPSRYKAYDRDCKYDEWNGEGIDESIEQLHWEEEMREWDEWEKELILIERNMDMRVFGW